MNVTNQNELETNIDTATVSIVFVVIALVVYIPIILYLAYPLHKGRNGIILQKRHADLTLGGIYALIIDIVIISFCQLLFWNAGTNLETPKSWFIVLFCILIILLQFTSQLFTTSFNVRLWITYYDIQYFNLIGSNEWKNIIDQNYNVTQSFFIKCKATLGNKKFFKLLLWTCCIIITLITSGLAVMDGLDKNMMKTGYMLKFVAFTVACNIWIQIILSIFMYFKLGKVKYFDDFYILKEFTAYFKVLIAALILFVIVIPGIIFIIVQIFPSLHRIERNDTLIVLASYWFFHGFILLHILVIYVMTRYIIQKLQKDPALLKQYGESLRKLSYGVRQQNRDNNEQIEMGCDLAFQQLDTGKEILLIDILSKQEYLESFMEHLALEFSQECLLSLVEFIQFRQFVRSQNITISNVEKMNMVKACSDSSVRNEELLSIELPTNIPKSSIVFNQDYDDRYKAQLIFEKYIVEGSEHEINISSRLRSKMTDTFQAPSGLLRTLSGIARSIDNVKTGQTVINGLPFVFDECCEEMLRLLRYSLSRFKNKPQYLKLEKFQNSQND